MASFHADHALLPDGWAEGVRIDVSGNGTIVAVQPNGSAEGAERLSGPVLPGMPNLHSHAFQRAMAGLAERVGGPAGADDFWSWRQLMYALVERLEPDDVEAIAAQVYLEMLKAGYTAVGEFHYLHHAADGGSYDDPAEMSHRMIGAARRVGMAITLLPVLYAHGDFGGAPAQAQQRRFLTTPDELLDVVERLQSTYPDDPQVRVGIAPHSLRAVSPDMLAALVAGAQAMDEWVPIHIHIAEQVREVDGCLAHHGARPVEWLLTEAPVDGRWCLVHATHMTAAESASLAASDAVVGLCPTTEANLGDGLFSLRRYLAAEGKFGIGSDSNISVDPIEELRWLDYGQRLVRRTRLVAAGEEQRSFGEAIFRPALDGGAQALGRPIGRIAADHRCDLVVLRPDHPALLERRPTYLLDSMIFAGDRSVVRDVYVGGVCVVEDGHHGAESRILAAYRRAATLVTA